MATTPRAHAVKEVRLALVLRRREHARPRSVSQRRAAAASSKRSKSEAAPAMQRLVGQVHVVRGTR